MKGSEPCGPAVAEPRRPRWTRPHRRIPPRPARSRSFCNACRRTRRPGSPGGPQSPVNGPSSGRAAGSARRVTNQIFQHRMETSATGESCHPAPYKPLIGRPTAQMLGGDYWIAYPPRRPVLARREGELCSPASPVPGIDGPVPREDGRGRERGRALEERPGIPHGDARVQRVRALRPHRTDGLPGRDPFESPEAAIAAGSHGGRCGAPGYEAEIWAAVERPATAPHRGPPDRR